MASSRFSSNAPDLTDVVMNLLAFETMNRVRLEVRMNRKDVGVASDLSVTVVAHPAEGEIGEVTPLGSVNVLCSATRLKTLEACIIHALYLLDSKLAWQEFDATIKKGV